MEQNETKPRILQSWKEIAAYLRRGVRTAQRYERELGMPVHRPASKKYGSVCALTQELDAWFTTTSSMGSNDAICPYCSGTGHIAGPAQPEVRIERVSRRMVPDLLSGSNAAA